MRKELANLTNPHEIEYVQAKRGTKPDDELVEDLRQFRAIQVSDRRMAAEEGSTASSPPTAANVLNDPKFLGLPPAEQSKVLRRIDQNFAAMPDAEQGKVLERLSAMKQPRAMAPPTQPGTPPQPPTPSWGHTAEVAASGFNKGLAGTIGAPVDLVNAGLKFMGLPMGDAPFMGSEFIQQYLLPTPVEPMTGGERMVGRIGQEVGATAPMIGGSLAARTAKVAEEGAGVVGRMIKDLQAIDPGKLVAVETGLAASGGMGAAVMNDIFPEGGWKADFVGEVIGSLGPTAALGVIRSAIRGIKAIPSKIGFKSTEELEQQVGERLNTLGRGSKVTEGIEETARIQQDIPDFRPTTAQVSGEPGLIQAERSLERSQSARTYTTPSGSEAPMGPTLRQDNQTAIRSAVEEVAPQGRVGDVATGIERERSRREALLDIGTARAQAKVDAQKNLISVHTTNIVGRTERQMEEADARAAVRLEALSPKMTPQQQAAIIRQEYAKELDTYAAAAGAKYAKVDQRIPLPVDEIHSAAKLVRQELRTQEAPEFIPSGALADMERLGMREETIVKGPMAKPIKRQVQVEVPFGELNALKKRLDGEIRAAGNDTLRRRLNMLRDGVERNIDQLVDNPDIKAAHPDAANAYDEARSFARKGIYRLKSGEIDTLRQLDKKGREKVESDDVAQRFLDGHDSLNDFVQAVGSRPAARMALEDAAKLDLYDVAFDKSTKKINPKLADKWMHRHQPLLKEFPELATTVLDAKKAQTYADETRKVGEKILKDPEAMARVSDPAMFDRLDKVEQQAAKVAATVKRTQADWERSAAGFFLNDDADRAAKRIIGSATPATKINEVVKQLGNDPVAKRGFERAMWDEALGRFESRAVDALDRPVLMARAGKEFLEENRTWMEPLFGKERMQRMETALKASEMVERSGRPVHPGGSDTAANLQTSISDLGPLLSRFYAHQRGVVSLKWIVGERVARTITGVLQKGTETQAKALLNQAFYDPEVARTFMLAAKGGQERIIKQRMRLHLLNMNQLDVSELDEQIPSGGFISQVVPVP